MVAETADGEIEVLVFDTETTGTDPRRDQVIELCLQKGLGGDAQAWTQRFKPEVEIPAEATAIHGITAADLADCPPFSRYAAAIRKRVESARVLVGYNLRFDVEMLQAEYERLSLPALELSGALLVDPFRLWQQQEPRRLVDAYARFVGGDLDDAHSAEADVAATGDVLVGMMKQWGLADAGWEAVADACDPDRRWRVGGTPHLRWRADGAVLIDFGRHQGRELAELAGSGDSGYLRWICGKDFPAHVRDACDAALRLSSADLRGWLADRFGSPPDPDLEGDG